MFRRSLTEILAVALASLCCLVLMVSGAPLVLTIPAGLLLAFLPGIVAVCQARSEAMGGFARLAAVIAASLGILAVLGCVLTWLPGGIDRRSWALALLLTTTLLVVGAIARRQRCSLPKMRLPRPAARGVISVMVGVLALLGAVVVSLQSASQADNEPFTEISAVPAGPLHRAAVGSDATLMVTNHEHGFMHYRLVIVTRSEHVTRNFSLKDGATYEQSLALTKGGFTASLYRGDEESKPYRQVWLRGGDLVPQS